MSSICLVRLTHCAHCCPFTVVLLTVQAWLQKWYYDSWLLWPQSSCGWDTNTEVVFCSKLLPGCHVILYFSMIIRLYCSCWAEFLSFQCWWLYGDNHFILRLNCLEWNSRITVYVRKYQECALAHIWLANVMCCHIALWQKYPISKYPSASTQWYHWSEWGGCVFSCSANVGLNTVLLNVKTVWLWHWTLQFIFCLVPEFNVGFF